MRDNKKLVYELFKDMLVQHGLTNEKLINTKFNNLWDKRKRARRGRGIASVECFAMRYYKEGEQFYSDKSDSDLQSLANKEGVKIHTEQMQIFRISEMLVKQITRVTIASQANK